MTPSLPVKVGAETARLYQEMRDAAQAAAAWTKRYEELKAALLAASGYDGEDKRPPSRIACGPGGLPLFEVAVSYRKGLDTKGLAAAHPAIYAQFETSTAVKSIKAPQA